MNFLPWFAVAEFVAHIAVVAAQPFNALEGFPGAVQPQTRQQSESLTDVPATLAAETQATPIPEREEFEPVSHDGIPSGSPYAVATSPATPTHQVSQHQASVAVNTEPPVSEKPQNGGWNLDIIDSHGNEERITPVSASGHPAEHTGVHLPMGGEHGGAHGGEEHEEGEEHGEEHEEGNEAVTVTAAACLLGMTASIQVLFYLTNCRYFLVRAMTWRMVSATVSIFSAILVFSVLQTVLCPNGHPPFPCMWLIMVWVVSQAMLFFCKDFPLAVAGIATLWGHTTGFFAISDFSIIQEHYFEHNVLQSWSAVGIAVAVFTALCWATRIIRNKVALLDDGVVDETEKFWGEKCMEYEDDVITMALGLLISQCLRFQANGHYVGHEEDPRRYSSNGIAALYLAVFIMTIGLIVSTAFRQKLSSQVRGDVPEHIREVILRTTSIVQNLFGMTAAWTLLWGIRWEWMQRMRNTLESDIPAKLLLALAVSLGAVFVIFIMNVMTAYIPDMDLKALRAIMSAVGLLVGLSWETTFSASIEELASSEFSGDPRNVKVFISLALVAVVFPSWMYYVLPKTDKHLAKYGPKVEMKSDDDLQAALENTDEEEEQSSVASGDDTPRKPAVGGYKNLH